MGSTLVVEARSLSRVYASGDVSVHALRDVSFAVDGGEFMSVMGASGSGKSTLLHLLGCLDRPTAGSLRVDGRELSGLDDRALSALRGQTVGFVFQSFNLVPQLDITGNVELPMLYARVPPPERRARALEALSLLGLSDRAHHRPTELSGGQCQRAAIARALVNRPRLLLADEPTGNLDSETGRAIIGLFQALNGAGLTVVMVTHDRDLASTTSRVLRLRDGAIERDEAVAAPVRVPVEAGLAERLARFWGGGAR